MTHLYKPEVTSYKYKLELENGTYFFKLEELLKKKHISKNQIMRDTNTDFKVLQRLMRGNIEKVDLIVLARICDYLNCEIIDIFEYVRN